MPVEKIPRFYDQFSCIGSDCEDNCCSTNYKIDVNKACYKHLIYKSKLTDTEKSYLLRNKDSKKKSEYATMRLNHKGACHFLTEKNLCGLYATAGEQWLPQACKDYPRAWYKRGGDVEFSMTLSCPEVVRKVCFDPNAWVMREQPIKQSGKANKSEEKAIYFDLFRMLVVNILNIEDASMDEKVYTLCISFANLCPYIEKPPESMVEAIMTMHESITEGHVRMLYQQHPNGQVQSSIFFTLMFNKINAYLNQYPKSSRRMRELYVRLKKIAQHVLKQNKKFNLDNAWFDLISDPQAQARYHAYMQTRPHAWKNFILHLMWSSGLPHYGTALQIFHYMSMSYIYLRHCLLCLAYHQPLTDDDFVLVIQSLSMLENNAPELLNDLIQSLADLFEMKTDDGFSLSELFCLKLEYNAQEQAVVQGLSDGASPPDTSSPSM